MTRPRTSCLLLAALTLALAVQAACNKGARWEKANHAGMKAYKEGRYSEAERH